MSHRISCGGQPPDDLARGQHIFDDLDGLSSPHRRVIKVPFEIDERRTSPGVTRELERLPRSRPHHSDGCPLTRTLSRRRASGGIPLLEGSVSKRPRRRAGPGDVVEILGVDGVFRGTFDDAALSS